MYFFLRMRNKIKGIDPFYGEVNTKQIGLYQHYFSKIINSIDIDTQTKWSQSKGYDRQQMSSDEEVMEKLITLDAASEGLSPAIMQVMVNQYFFADAYQRELDREDWVKRVLYRKDADYFPSGSQVRTLLDRVTE